MPAKTKMKSRKYKKKRTYSKKKVTTLNRGNVVLGKGFPKKLTFTHKYNQGNLIISNTGILTGIVYSCNDLRKPCTSFNIGVSGSHQPYYFDQLSALYDHYVVIGSKCTVKFLNSAGNTGAIYGGLYISDVATGSATNFSQLSELNKTNYKYLTYGASEALTLSAAWSAKKYFGGSILSNTELQGSGTTSPTEQSYFNFSIQCLDSASTVSVFAEVSIEYIAVWKEFINVGQS